MIGAGDRDGLVRPAFIRVVLAISPLLWWIGRAMRGRLSQAYREVQESFSRVTATIAESVAVIRVTQALAREETNADLFRKADGGSCPIQHEQHSAGRHHDAAAGTDRANCLGVGA